MAKKRPPINSIADLYALAGNSPTKLAASLDLEAWSCENWRYNGIPMRAWQKLIDIYNVSPAELYYISKKCRATKRPG